MSILSIFVNLPVKDLEKSKAFFTELGFTFNPKYTDENAACMKICEKIYAMFITETFFKTFTKREITDSESSIETIVALSTDSRETVNRIVKKALEIGGNPANDPYDHRGMYGWSFHDLDNHMWEVFYMDENLQQSEQG